MASCLLLGELSWRFDSGPRLSRLGLKSRHRTLSYFWKDSSLPGFGLGPGIVEKAESSDVEVVSVVSAVKMTKAVVAVVVGKVTKAVEGVDIGAEKEEEGEEARSVAELRFRGRDSLDGGRG